MSVYENVVYSGPAFAHLGGQTVRFSTTDVVASQQLRCSRRKEVVMEDASRIPIRRDSYCFRNSKSTPGKGRLAQNPWKTLGDREIE